LGVPEEIAEAMIAHRRPDLVGRYNRAQLWDQRRKAAEKFDVWMTELLGRVDGAGDENVIAISAARTVKPVVQGNDRP
jgi:hypothetical protein